VSVDEDPAIEGVPLIGGELVPLVDCHRLFATSAAPARRGVAPTCRIPDDSEWARAILEPLVRAAGYRVTRDASLEADVAILIDEAEPAIAPSARACIRLTSDPEGEPDAIYRYDREALLGALRHATRGVAS